MSNDLDLDQVKLKAVTEEELMDKIRMTVLLSSERRETFTYTDKYHSVSIFRDD